MKWLIVLAQVADFFLKSATSYASSPEGAKEFNDILKAVEDAEGAEGTPPSAPVARPSGEIVRPKA